MHFDLVKPWETYPTNTLSAHRQNKVCMYTCMYGIIPCSTVVFFFNYLFIIFIFGCVGSSFLCEGFLHLRRVGATLHRGARASHYRGLSYCGAEAPDAQAQ